MEITLDQLRQICPLGRTQYLDDFVRDAPSLLPQWGINTQRRVAYFLAQVAHETNGLTVLEENLRYSAQRLTEVWPSRFPTVTIARAYEYSPEKLANFIYADRLGNGPSHSGDGWRYRGRGCKQTTGRWNYERLATRTGLDVVQNPDLVAKFPVALIAACVFWADNNLNFFADVGDVTGLTRKVNGGLHGLAERQRYTEAAEIALAMPAQRVRTLRKGAIGDDVQILQQALNREMNVKITGEFDANTDRLVRAYQFSRGLVVDGIVGPKTLAALSS